MDDSGRVDRLQRLHEPLGDGRDHGSRQGCPTDKVLQGLALNEVHDEMGSWPLCLDRSDPGHPMAVDAAERLRLVPKPDTDVRGTRDLPVQQLDRDALPRGTLGQIDDAGGARSKPRQDPVALDVPWVVIAERVGHHGSGYCRAQSAAASCRTASLSDEVALYSASLARSMAACSLG